MNRMTMRWISVGRQDFADAMFIRVADDKINTIDFLKGFGLCLGITAGHHNP